MGCKRSVEVCQQTLPIQLLLPPLNIDQSSAYPVPTTSPGSGEPKVDRMDEAVPCGAHSLPASLKPTVPQTPAHFFFSSSLGLWRPPYNSSM